MLTAHSIHCFVEEQDRAEYERRVARAKALRRCKRKGLTDPTLGRIPRGADLAEAQMLAGEMVQVVVN